ncbi:MAG: MATE family efflux transporter [Rhizobiaceae bacterium]
MSLATTPRFVTGSTLRHVLVMTATSSVGLMAVFLVDVLNLLYISMLGKQQLAAAIGYSGTLMFFLTSVAIGLTIATSAQVSRALGQENNAKAAELGGAGLLLMAGTMVLLSAFVVAFARPLTAMMGAQGETLDISVRFMNMVVPSMPLMAVGMSAAALLRAKGDARRSMYVTLAAAAVTAVLDPLFIFTFKLGIDGAAIVTVISRFALLGVGLYCVISIHKMLTIPSRATLLEAAKPYFAIGLPAVMTQLATPVGNAWVTAEMAKFGDDAVAAWAIIGRVTPVAFGAIFALSGAVGPILGQNYGARRFDRIQSTMYDSFKVVIVYVLIVWLLLALLRNPISDLFGATDGMRELISFYFVYVTGTFVFAGLLFVANAAFNNLGFPFYSTMANWGRATLGVIPFVSLGALWYGPQGALAGSGLGTVIFGLGATIVCLRVLKTLEAKNPPTDELQPPPAAQSPFSTGKAATLG